ncbi:MAG TPA: copper transporter [Solirubrobacteraceae bacterium]|jgi:hypothetical protein|nr:copper transporter [Solirubrobacteraceae bacterium]
MFDYRYHALSLAAVLFALALGVLIGVAIGDSNLVSSAKDGIVHKLNVEVGDANERISDLRGSLTDEQAFAKGLYPLAVRELLSGHDVGLVFLGNSSDEVNSLVRSAVTAGGGSLVTVAAVREPLDLEAIDEAAAGTHYATLAESVPLVEHFGELVGRQLVSGGQAVNQELINRVRGPLMSALDGPFTRLQGVVVMRAEPTEMEPEQSEAAAAFESGLLAGIAAVGVPAVGVELSNATESQIPWYKGKHISSVDDVDEQAGQASLIYALAGYSGTFGIKGTADSLLPALTGATQP